MLALLISMLIPPLRSVLDDATRNRLAGERPGLMLLASRRLSAVGESIRASSVTMLLGEAVVVVRRLGRFAKRPASPPTVVPAVEELSVDDSTAFEASVVVVVVVVVVLPDPGRLPPNRPAKVLAVWLLSAFPSEIMLAGLSVVVVVVVVLALGRRARRLASPFVVPVLVGSVGVMESMDVGLISGDSVVVVVVVVVRPDPGRRPPNRLLSPMVVVST